MIILLFCIVYITCICLCILFYYTNKKVEILLKNHSTMVGWCNTLRQNEDILLKDIKKLSYDLKSYKKEINK
jgi:hypothetical protein